MYRIKIFLFNKLADLVFKITQSSYYKNLQSESHAHGFKSLGQDCKFNPQTYILNKRYISIGQNFQSLWNFRLEAHNAYDGQRFNPEIVIGDNVTINTDVHIGCINKVYIGNNCLLASRIFISDHDHGMTSYEEMQIEPSKRRLHSKGPVIIEDNCWIGEGVSILSGVTIGRNSIVATNSVVTKDVPPFCIVAGIPAKIIKKVN